MIQHTFKCHTTRVPARRCPVCPVFLGCSSFSGFYVFVCLRTANRIERVVIAGVGAEPSSVTLQMATPAALGGGEAAAAAAVPLDFAYDAVVRVLTVRKPDVCVVDDFDLRLSFAAAAS